MKASFLLIGLLLAVCAVPAQADTACFDWSCSTTGLCSINATCSSASPYIWKYDFDFGDGVTTGLTGNATQSHQYGSSVYNAYVTVRIVPWSSNPPSSVTCLINTRLPVVGPQPPASYYQGHCTQ